MKRALRQYCARRSNKVNSDLKLGVGKFESQLEFVGLHELSDVSDDLRRCILHAQQVRNVWAHRSGHADKHFLEHCSSLGYEHGERVKISSSKIREFLAGLVIYGLVITNRFRASHGLGPYPWPLTEENPLFADPYRQRWGHISPETGWWVHRPLFERLSL